MDYYDEFLQKAKQVNRAMIESNERTMKEPAYLEEGLQVIRDRVFELVGYYRANEFELTDASEKFSLVENSWNEFVGILQEKSKKPKLTVKDQKELGASLQKVFEQNKVLIRKLIRHSAPLN